MFIIFLPVILMAFAFIIDVGLMFNAKIKGTELLKSAVKEKVDVKDYFKINNINIESLEEINKNGKSCVIINYKIDSIFGSLMGFKDYSIEVDNC